MYNNYLVTVYSLLENSLMENIDKIVISIGKQVFAGKKSKYTSKLTSIIDVLPACITISGEILMQSGKRQLEKELLWGSCVIFLI